MAHLRFPQLPPPPLLRVHIPDDGLCSLIDVHMLDPDVLVRPAKDDLQPRQARSPPLTPAATPEPGENRHSGGVRASHLDRNRLSRSLITASSIFCSTRPRHVLLSPSSRRRRACGRSGAASARTATD